MYNAEIDDLQIGFRVWCNMENMKPSASENNSHSDVEARFTDFCKVLCYIFSFFLRFN